MARFLPVAIVILAGVAGCMLYGAEDDDVDLPGRTDDAGADASASDAPSNDAATDGNLQPDVFADAGPRLKQIDFEKGKLIDPPLGLDEALGIKLIDAGALQGLYAMRPEQANSYGRAKFPKSDEVYITFRVRFDSGASNGERTIGRLMIGDTEVLDFGHGSGASRTYRVRINGVGYFADAIFLEQDKTKSVGLHMRKATNAAGNNGLVQLFGVFDAGTFEMKGEWKDLPLTAVDGLDIGGPNGGAIEAVFDDIKVDRLALP